MDPGEDTNTRLRSLPIRATSRLQTLMSPASARSDSLDGNQLPAVHPVGACIRSRDARPRKDYISITPGRYEQVEGECGRRTITVFRGSDVERLVA